MKRKEKFQLWMPSEVLWKLRAIAEEEGRTVSDLIKEAVAEWLDKKEKEKSRPIKLEELK
ncbi:MAG: ribbon-helix-helix protein, CopG family [Aquificota bacterium]|nr:MAG: ribbon-helix-helix protein, CopG family [Aquificota bacterium]QWK13453.1 MAG: ribbon-helix-helix protein, CopG family [Aquificota bacterium]